MSQSPPGADPTSASPQGPCAPHSGDGGVRVRVREGVLDGARVGSVRVFRGVPYARAQRFQPPQPPQAWEGVRPATAPGVLCPQLPSRLAPVMGPSPGGLAMSEDCLVLSVYAPNGAAPCPVMVWIHGGAYVTGGGEEAWYDATRLAQEGQVVVVTITHRLGTLGYLYTDEFGATNAGLHDQLAALQWIHQNIAAFGGDPENITLFGQSAGGHAVACLLASPDRPPLRRAIIQSAPLAQVVTEAKAREISRRLVQALGQSPLTASTAELLAAQGAVLAQARAGLTFGPIGVHPLQTRWSDVAPMDIWIGWNRDDAAAFVALRHQQRPYGGRVDRFLTRLGAWQAFAAPSQWLGARLRRAQHRVAVYRIGWRPPGSPYGATHCVELPLLFGWPQAWAHAPLLGSVSTTEWERLGREARALWAGFAHDGAVPPTTAWLESRTL